LSEPFQFSTELRLVELTGRNARSLPELLRHLTEVSGSSIFYHTHDLYLAHHFRKPKFYDDFANWAAEALREEDLAEQLAAIDLLTISSIRELRERILGVIRRRLESGAKPKRECPPGDEFHFCEAKSFVMPLDPAAHDVAEFFAQISKVSTSCLHFHFFEARLRLAHPTNDFSEWLWGMGEDELARKIDRLNPYIMSLDELKAEIVKLGRGYRRESK
jgi:Family of unknown function (DUF5752)